MLPWPRGALGATEHRALLGVLSARGRASLLPEARAGAVSWPSPTRPLFGKSSDGGILKSCDFPTTCQDSSMSAAPKANRKYNMSPGSAC